MKKAIATMALAMVLTGSQTVAAETAPVSVPASAPTSNPEMKRIYDGDQADRTGEINAKTLGPNDAARRQQTRKLLAEGQLHSGDDFLEAAFVFQHGSDDDFLLAHTLAIIATKKGAAGGPWIAAATLDRYLQNHGAKQIYGTQYSSTRVNGQDGEWTNEPYDRDLISDALRTELGVPDQAAQAQKLARMKARSASVAATAPTARTSSDGEVRCDGGPIDRVFVRVTWKVRSCGNDLLAATLSGDPTTVITVYVQGDKTIVHLQGQGDPSEAKVAQAAFQAMTPAQVADIVAQTKP